jgi:hypothetical protein
MAEAIPEVWRGAGTGLPNLLASPPFPVIPLRSVVVDPNATLADIRETVAKTYREGGATLDDTSHLFDLVESIDNWLSKGGFLPDAWATASPVAGELNANDHILTRAGHDLDGPSLPYVLGASLMLHPQTPIFVRLKKREDRAAFQFGHCNACVMVYAETPQVARLATLFAHTRDRLNSA